MGLLIVYSVALVCAAAFLVWLYTKNGKRWLEGMK